MDSTPYTGCAVSNSQRLPQIVYRRKIRTTVNSKDIIVIKRKITTELFLLNTTE